MFKNSIWFNLHETESTNSFLHEQLMSEKLPEGSVVTADYQTKGRGQRGSSWQSEAGKNLLMSIVVYPDFLKASEAFVLSKCIALATCDLLADYSNQVRIKWPNDILIEGKKVAGILIENILRGADIYATIAGIGINFNQQVFEVGLNSATSVFINSGVKADTQINAVKLHENIEVYYQMLQQKKIEEIDRLYLAHLYKLNETALFKDADGPFQGKIKGLSPMGLLIVERENGEKHLYDVKEISLVR
ncbi:MAG TPA: biotin--[acetyl-CoA-carboxylase] ligase [Bacteroidia bacterium]|jgi:BirA family biotin operon repressor/biotin-[acetyl-CoA-carboxylase] ligase|nr:biotin--[acetyl-CoA-carboxylase] ligase [Bacteroidia bacterium]HMU18345.1 biotin--[acetyl-CoA-carboxylase] ligase [Bacteroidia bacterium]